VIQSLKHDGDKAMPTNKDGLLLRYRETHTRVIRTYPREDAAATPAATADVASDTPAATTTFAAARSTHDPKTFALASNGNPAAAYAAPVTLVATSDPRTPAAGAIVADVAAVAAASPVAIT
jgi:hypothetical protein